jgi:DNA-binding IclR family transcriptional regulator
MAEQPRRPHRRNHHQVRQHGFALKDREFVEDLRPVATPILDHPGRVVATLSIGRPAQDLQGAELDALTGTAGHGSFEVSRQFGYRDSFPVIATLSGILPGLGPAQKQGEIAA